MSDKECRVLIVDDLREDAAQTAEELKGIRPSLLEGNTLDIQLANTAYSVADRLRKCPDGEPPWDVIIADIFMPIPCTAQDQETASTRADPTDYPPGSGKWTLWEFKYLGGLDSPKDASIEHGGIHIARTIRTLKEEGKDLGSLKLVMVSRQLCERERRILNEFKSESLWCTYYDKTNWEDSSGRERWQLTPNVFKWALIQAIRERESEWWADAALSLVDKDYRYVLEGTSSAMQTVLVEARRIAADLQTKAVLVQGEDGVCARGLASLLHQSRMRRLVKSGEPSGEFVEVECASLSLMGQDVARGQLIGRVEPIVRAKNGTLCLIEIGNLPPAQRKDLYQYLLKLSKETAEPPPVGPRLIICTTSRGLAAQGPGTGNPFHLQLRSLLEKQVLTMPSLSDRPEDVAPLACHLLEKWNQERRVSLSLDEEAEEWLRAQQWLENTAALAKVICHAASTVTSDNITVRDLKETSQRLAPPSRRTTQPATGTPKPTQVRKRRKTEAEITLNLDTFTIFVSGRQPLRVKGRKRCDFLAELAHSKRTALTVGKWKTIVDGLRKTFKNNNLGPINRLIDFVQGGYLLHPDVKVTGGSSLGIRRTSD